MSNTQNSNKNNNSNEVPSNKNSKSIKVKKKVIENINRDIHTLKTERKWLMDEVEEYKEILTVFIRMIQSKDMTEKEIKKVNEFLKTKFKIEEDLFKYLKSI